MPEQRAAKSRSASFFVDMNVEGGIISSSMALEMRYVAIQIQSGQLRCASRLPLIPNPKKRGGETQK
jgi:hypothetical protein